MLVHIQVRILDNNSQNFTGGPGQRGILQIILFLNFSFFKNVHICTFKGTNCTLIVLIENELLI